MFPDTGEYRECPYVNMTTGAGYIHWYGLKVFFNKVFEIESLLSADGVESYIPCEMVTVEVRGIWKQVRRTVIPSLMFFRSTEEYAKELQTSLRGRVMPVGGIKEKILAAKRAGIHEIILSEDNRKDISEIKPEYLGGLKFNYVKTNSDVLKLAVM